MLFAISSGNFEPLETRLSSYLNVFQLGVRDSACRRGGVVVRASASQSVDLGFIF